MRLWSAFDVLYALFVIHMSIRRGDVPFIDGLLAGLDNMQRWGGGLDILIWGGFITQLSVIASAFLLGLNRFEGILLSAVQLPFRLLFIVPSVSVLLLFTVDSNWVWWSLMLLSEFAKAVSLRWLWKTRTRA